MDIYVNKFTADGVSMKYMKFGKGAKTMVIIPGLSIKSVIESADAVANQYRSMTDDFTVYLFDRRDDLPDSYTIEEMAEDTFIAVKGLGLENIYLFGASQGGMISLVIAARHPELVARLAVGSTCARFDASDNPAIGEWIRLAKERKGVELFMDFASRLYPASIAESLKDFLISSGSSVTDEEFERFITLVEGTAGFDIRDELPAVRCPVLVLGSEDDAVVGKEGSYEIYSILSRGGRARIHMYCDKGHASFDTAEDYRDRLTAFFLKASE